MTYEEFELKLERGSECTLEINDKGYSIITRGKGEIIISEHGTLTHNSYLNKDNRLLERLHAKKLCDILIDDKTFREHYESNNVNIIESW